MVRQPVTSLTISATHPTYKMQSQSQILPPLSPPWHIQIQLFPMTIKIGTLHPTLYPKAIKTDQDWAALTAHLWLVLSSNRLIHHMYISMLQYFKNFIFMEVPYLVLYTEPDYFSSREMDYFISADCYGLFHPAPLHPAPEWLSRHIMPHGSRCSLTRHALV